MNTWIQQLRVLGINCALFKLIEQHQLTIVPDSYLYAVVATAAQNGHPCSDFMKLLALDVACAEWLARDLAPIDVLQILCTPGVSTAEATAKVAEVIAGGLLGTVFPAMRRIPEQKKAKTPDFTLGQGIYAEVYCPQESATETQKYEKWLAETIAPVKLLVTYPITGSSPLARAYSSNVVIDRAVSGKRDKDQFSEGAENLLWLDFLHGFDISSSDTKPYTTKHKGENTFVGSFGVWHSLYGEPGSLFAAERTDLRYLRESNIYKQQRQGLFRERPVISAAVLLVADGILLFENPWSSTPLSEPTKQSLKGLLRFKPDMSFLSVEPHSLEDRIKAILSEIEWLYKI